MQARRGAREIDYERLLRTLLEAEAPECRSRRPRSAPTIRSSRGCEDIWRSSFQELLKPEFSSNSATSAVGLRRKPLLARRGGRDIKRNIAKLP